MSDRFKTLIVVTLCAVLIWTYADSQSIQTRTFPGVLLRVPEPSSTAQGSPVMWLPGLDGPRFQVSLVVEGSAAALDRFRADLIEAIDLTASPAFPIEPGRHVVPLATVLEEHPLFREAGLSVEADPPTVEVHVDTIHRASLRVDAPDLPGMDIETRAANAELVLPRSVWETVRAGITSLFVRLDMARVENLDTGIQHTLPSVPIQTPALLQDAPFLEIEPATITLLVTIRDPRAETILSTVFFYVILPDNQVGRWNVEVTSGGDDFLRDVKVIGPTDLIERINAVPPQLTIRALVQLTQDQLDQRVENASAVFSLMDTQLQFEIAGEIVESMPVDLAITPVEQSAPDDESPMPLGV